MLNVQEKGRVQRFPGWLNGRYGGDQTVTNRLAPSSSYSLVRGWRLRDFPWHPSCCQFKKGRSLLCQKNDGGRVCSMGVS